MSQAQSMSNREHRDQLRIVFGSYQRHQESRGRVTIVSFFFLLSRSVGSTLCVAICILFFSVLSR